MRCNLAFSITTEGKATFLGWMLASTDVPDNMTIHLYSNAASISSSTVLEDLTESVWDGYTATSLLRGSFSVDTSGGTATASYTTVTWTAGGAISPADINGYYICDSDDNLILAEAFPSTYVIDASATISIIPTVSLT